MKEELISLNDLPIGGVGKVKRLNTTGGVRRRMQDLGLIDDTVVKALRKSPSGDPIAYNIRGAVMALRQEESSKIFVSKF